ncbi:MAG: adenylosuccinate lyase [Acholeplasmataceae bacterium]|nr:adenylosuccinate lyase [Acholeplasmataceae bacterium]
MIERYTTKEMQTIWNGDYKYNTWLQVELAVLEAYRNRGIIPDYDFQKIKNNALVNPARIKELELLTRHDVIAFTRQISETLGEEKKWVHYGLTSTDVVDTANACLLKEANTVILDALDAFIEILKKKALAYKSTPCIGRTHGIHAEVTSFGLKFLLFYDEALRNRERFLEARSEIEKGKLSGAVGNFANIDPEIEEEACKLLGLGYARISTQVLPRDLHCHYLHSLALIASLIEKIATEIRHLSRTEVREVEEYFAANQKGSSAMPHKRNPITSENMCGLARVVRSYALTTYENNILWHERDISHSSTERIILADATTLIHYMLTRYAKVLEQLVVYEERMYKNIYLTNGLIFSGNLVGLLIKKGLSREAGYDLIQKYALEADQNDLDFRKLILASEVRKYANPEEIESCFKIDYYLRNIDKIYTRMNLGVKDE